jgi:hypothetical protein
MNRAERVEKIINNFSGKTSRNEITREKRRDEV